MNITILACGSRPWQLWRGYWGLSMLVNDSLLYDSFANYRTLRKRLSDNKVDPAQIEKIVISHDHWDHINGLWGFLQESRIENRPVYLPYGTKEETQQRIRDLGGNPLIVPAPQKLSEDVFLSQTLEGDFKGQKVAEHSLVLQTAKGMILLVGCGHPGILKMVQQAKKAFSSPIYGVIGGFHQMHDSEESISQCAQALAKEGVQMVAPTHCSGKRAERIFKGLFSQGYVSLCEGQRLAL
ncbi:MAG: MBL fold metallo-hydrolase [Alphaproteobacteria bacterium]|nr:MBL fold metallo-hydrolase [Alphaproteobacteria bacterium]